MLAPWKKSYDKPRQHIKKQRPYFAKLRLKLKKVGKTARPFRYDLNKIPYDYTGEVKNRFK